MNRFIAWLVVLVLLLIAFFVVLWIVSGRVGKDVTSFQECIEAGFTIQESYPRRCVTPEGKVFMEDIGNEMDKIHLIRTDIPRPNAHVKDSLSISGQARGSWFFEAEFPIVLLDANGNVLSTAIATAQGEWMTTEFVPFSATMTFQKPSTDKGTLVLKRANASGLPEHDDALIIPVLFN